jgi:hypothetical protein
MKMFAIRSYHLGIRDVTARRYGIETAKVAIRLTGNRQRKEIAPFFFLSENGKKNVVGSALKNRVGRVTLITLFFFALICVYSSL